MTKDLSLKKIYGLIGYPVKHSFSPAMHNAAFGALKINAEYRLFEVKPEELEGFLLENIPVQDTKGESFFSQDIVGFNITIPHKVRALEIARLVKNYTVRMDFNIFASGAINTVKRDDGRLSYRNTDITGFMQSLRQDLEFNTSNKSIFIFGCGGAGRAIIVGLTCKGTNVKKIYIYDKSKDTMDSTEKHFKQFSDYMDGDLEFVFLEEQIPDKIRECALLVNASPVGMKEGDDSIVDKKLLHDNLFVYDVVYNRKTQLIKDAESSGRPAKNGLGMLLCQGADAFELWTNQKAPVEVMRKALTEAMNK